MCCVCRESKLAKENEMKVTQLASWKVRFQQRIQQCAKQIKDFAQKDRMSEAEAYLEELKDLGAKLEEFTLEVGQ